MFEPVVKGDDVKNIQMLTLFRPIGEIAMPRGSHERGFFRLTNLASD
jgi:hypothetical protein